MQQQNLNHREYARLGRLLLHSRPDVAKELIESFEKNKASEDDLQKIKPFFRAFCAYRNIEPMQHVGPAYKVEKVDVRRLFIACIISMYAPALYKHASGALIAKHKLVSVLADVLHQKHQSISRMIKEIVIRYKALEDYREEVKVIVEHITKEVKTES